ncbi:unnamed protein product [Diplocarpon coronariae]|uniref:Cerato-platanin n=1 Tax=Diplocarpon coronariae TaxID=2795749 RepID=A0A218ZG20_9HELO|nr:hypothetical protein JHW43_000113 [Diplocarpon mali]OWP06702.1 hypothetical protein B2J93_5181 [Marssonina coronariae]
MKFQLAATLLSIATLASAIRVSYDSGYDDKDRDLNSVSCSDGDNGLKTKGFTTQGSLPRFPLIGGASVIGGWNDPNCGTCWTLTNGEYSVTILAVDRASEGFNIGKEAMNQLTGNRAQEVGVVDAQYVKADASACGLS